MATYRKRGERWHCQVRKKGFEPQTRSFETKAEAQRWARSVESEMDVGAFVSRKEAESTTLGEVIDRYEREVTPGKRGAVQERSLLRTLRETPLARRHLAAIRRGDVAALRDKWLAEKLAPSTVLRRLALLSHIFNTCEVSWKFESLANPVDGLKKLKLADARTRRIEPARDLGDAIAGEDDHGDRGAAHDELEAVVRASRSRVLGDAVLLAVETAMRRGEIAALLWSNIDLKRRVAHLPTTKNGNARDVPLSPKALAILSAIPRSASGRVFDVRADALTRAFDRSVQRARDSYVKECGRRGVEPTTKYLANLRFHDLRHEATSRLAGFFQMHELAKITGHRDPRMLLRYYHPRAEDLALRFPGAS